MPTRGDVLSGVAGAHDGACSAISQLLLHDRLYATLYVAQQASRRWPRQAARLLAIIISE